MPNPAAPGEAVASLSQCAALLGLVELLRITWTTFFSDRKAKILTHISMQDEEERNGYDLVKIQ
jgi:hypothetical protein